MVPCSGASLVAQMVKSLPAMQETRVWSLGQEDPLEKEMAPIPVFLSGKSHGQRIPTVYGVSKSSTQLTNLDGILKSRDITLPTKVRLFKHVVFSVVMYGCECWTVKKAERQRIDAFELWF